MTVRGLASGRRRAWRLSGYAMLSLGCSLILIASLGEWTGLGHYASRPPRSWERFDATLAARTRSLDALYRAAEGAGHGALRDLPPQQAMRWLFDVTAARFTHGASMHTPFSNWILWAAGRIHPALGAIRDPGNLLGHGESALCADISYVLMQLALQAGIRPRHVGLNGHVVMEAWYDGDWHMYDPDFEVVPADAEGAVMGVEALTRDAATLRRMYAGRSASGLTSERLVAIFTSREDNSFVAYPPGAEFEWKSQVLLRIEQATGILKFAIPALMLVLGSVMLARARRAL